MTEKKYEYCRGKYRHYIQDIEKDGVWKEGYRGTYGEFDLDKITVLLNRLNDENQRLKIKNRGLQSELEIRKADVDYANKISVELFDECKQYKKENEELKSNNNRLVNETAKIVAEHQRKVLDLIDDKIDELEEQYKFGQEVYRGCPMHNIGFGINVLKELKKELVE